MVEMVDLEKDVIKAINNYCKEFARRWFKKGWLCGNAITVLDLDYYFEKIWGEENDRTI